MALDASSILAGMQRLMPFSKASQTAEGAGTLHSLWKLAGSPPAGSNPPLFSAGSGYVPTKATAGAFQFNNPVTGNSYLGRLAAWGANPGMLVLYDRVWACSGFGTVVTTLQSVTTPGDVGRSATFEGLEMFLEVYSAPGATGANWTVTYSNQANTGGRTTVYAHPANAESVGQMVPLLLAAGDTGVRSVTSFQCSLSSGTAGDIGITVARRIAEIPLRPEGIDRDAFQLGLEQIQNDACLALLVQCSTTSTGFLSGSMKHTHVVP